MRKLDVKEIHGYERAKGLKLIRPDHAGPHASERGSAATDEDLTCSATSPTPSAPIRSWRSS